MAWRIADNVVRGEIDNRIRGIIKGELYLEGVDAPIELELEGNCCPDLAGRRLTFTNPNPVRGENLDRLDSVQCGKAGEMTADRMNRVPTVSDAEMEACLKERRPIPSRWSDSLYLEWYAGGGRVLVEGSSFACKLSAAKWELTEEEVRRKEWLEDRESDEFLADQDDAWDRLEAKEAAKAPTEAASGAKLEANPRQLVLDTASFMVRTIFEMRDKRLYADGAVENQPLMMMVDSTKNAIVRLANALAIAEVPFGYDRSAILHGLKRARWSLANAAENLGLAAHMGSADPDWLRSVESEFSDYRCRIKRVIVEYEKDK